MNYQCYSDNCVANPVGYCICSGVPTLFCIVHSNAHMMTNRDHRIYDILVNPLSEIHTQLLKISHLKISLKNTKKSIMSNSFKIIKLIENLIGINHNHINKLIKDCDEVILIAGLQFENTQMIIHDSIFSKLASDQIQINLKDWNDKMIKNYSHLNYLFREALDISDFCENQTMPLKGSKQPNTLDWDLLITQVNEKNSLPEDHDSFGNEIIFFKHKSKLVKTINLDSHEIQTKELNSLPEIIYSGISICELPNKSKFCYGNYSGLTFIIDQNQNITLLPNGQPNWGLDSNYFNEFIYAIGGYNKLAEKYNLLENKWESCANLSRFSNFRKSRSALNGSQIVIVGYYLGKVICYDINQDNYQKITGIYLLDNLHKFAFNGGNRVYIGECKMNVYESGENDLTRWTCISKTNPVTDKYQRSYYSLIFESVYFLNGDYNLYEFKLRTKEMKLIKNFKKE